MIDCQIIGDSIAVGVAQQHFNCTVNAKVGISSTAIVQRVGNAELTIISAGSNDPTNPKLISNLRNIRSKTKGKVIWIVPVNQVAAASVRLVAKEFSDAIVLFKAGRDGVHPKSYKELADNIRGTIEYGKATLK